MTHIWSLNPWDSISVTGRWCHDRLFWSRNERNICESSVVVWFASGWVPLKENRVLAWCFDLEPDHLIRIHLWWFFPIRWVKKQSERNIFDVLFVWLLSWNCVTSSTSSFWLQIQFNWVSRDVSVCLAVMIPPKVTFILHCIRRWRIQNS